MTVSALLEVLEHIQPEVVFAEIPRTHIESWRSGSHGTIESTAVALYADTHSFDIVAVDSPMPDDAFFQSWKEVTGAIDRTSPSFRRLMDINTDQMRQGGLTYLNSDECIQAWADIYREMLDTIEYIGNSRLRNAYAQSRDLMERRDLEMLGNIREYCISTALTRGVFLVGAAHRKSLIEKLHGAGELACSRWEWDVGGLQVGSV